MTVSQTDKNHNPVHASTVLFELAEEQPMLFDAATLEEMRRRKARHELLPEDDMPFGPEAEQRRERIEAEERDRPSIVAELREERRRYEQAAIARRERH